MKKTGFKTQLSKRKNTASGPTTSWQIQGGKVEAVTDFIFLGSKITADGDCSHGILKTLASWKDNKLRQSIKKQRHHFDDKDPYSESYGFPVVMYDCESWTIKKTKSQKIDVFELWYWRRFLRVPWTALSNQLIPKEINPEYSLENCC